MTKRPVLILLVWFSCMSAIYCQRISQEGRILFRGVVFSASTREKLVGSQIIKGSTTITFSRSDGTFSFYAMKLDTIVFMMLGYKPARLVVSDTLRSGEILTGVYLQADTLDIGEVVIVPKLTSLKAEIMNPTKHSDLLLENAKSNISIAAYQGRTGQPRTSDPYMNYEILRNRQKIDAYEKGGIPSDKMVSVSPFMLIPALYLLLHGLPEVPAPPETRISDKEMEELNRIYFDTLRKK